MRARNYAVLGIVVVAAAIAGGFLLAQHGAQDYPGVIVGVGTHGNASSELRALESGVRYFRNDISMSTVQISQIRNQSAGYGASYLGILDYSTLPGGISNKDWNLTEWNATVANAVRAYPEISTWEVWNEPLVPMFQTGYVNGSARNYYELIRSTYVAVKSIEPNATLVCFGGAMIPDYNSFTWYEKVWSYGASEYCGAVSLHAYPSLPFNQSERDTWTAYVSAYENMTGKPVWITETGLPSSSAVYSGLSPQVQAQFLEQDFAFFSSFPYVKRVYWYDLWGLSDGKYQNDYGLLNLSDPYYGTPSPAWETFLRAYNDSMSAR